MADMKEPPVLKDRNGDNIVIFRRPDGEFFSNNPDFPMAMALYEQNGSDADEVDEDEAVQPDNGDGKVEYDEMQSKQLLAEAKNRELTVPAKPTRSALIELLEADDAKKAGQ